MSIGIFFSIYPKNFHFILCTILYDTFIMVRSKFSYIIHKIKYRYLILTNMSQFFTHTPLNLINVKTTVSEG